MIGPPFTGYTPPTIYLHTRKRLIKRIMLAYKESKAP